LSCNNKEQNGSANDSIESLVQTPDDLYPALFDAVQMSDVFPDSKTFVDCIAKKSATEINKLYKTNKGAENFDLKSFVEEHFIIPPSISSDFEADMKKNASEHVASLWEVLKRASDKDTEGSTLLALPKPYIVPGGRFREVYYWDSYFTMLGLKESGEVEMIKNMLDNFAFLIEKVGHIPNGNRSYYITRSQPPFFSQMVKLYAEIKGEEVYREYEKALLAEYQFWMKGAENLMGDKLDANDHVVSTEYGMLNRYFDIGTTPRQESHREDFELVGNRTNAKKMYSDLRSGAESGWDYSSRWFADAQNMSTIETTDIIPVDLNSLIYGLEEIIVTKLNIGEEKQTLVSKRMEDRKRFINEVCFASDWSYRDYNWKEGRVTERKSLAMVYPLFFGIATQSQADKIKEQVSGTLLRPGGVVTSIYNTGQQWDAPNGWAPLQWMTVAGLENYGHSELAVEISERWTKLNEKVYKNTGKFVEKYNVEDLSLEAGGGEYPVQDGFGWSNGVYLAMKAYLKK